jgi:regulator of RNase E activity RraA
MVFCVNSPSSDLVSRVSSASISDAMAQRFSHRWHVLDLVSPTHGRVLHGWAATVQFLPRREDVRDAGVHDFAPATLAVAGDDAAGRVLVVATGSYRDAAVAGGKKLTLVDSLGFAGLVTDGRLRDFDEARELGSTAYCAGETILADRSDVMAFRTDVPVELAGALAVPGDWIYADSAGAVIVPADVVVEVLEAAVERERADAAESQSIRRSHRRAPHA